MISIGHEKFTTLFSHDPAIFDLTLSQEYNMLQRAFGLTLEDLRRANLQAVEAGFVSSEHKPALRMTIEKGYPEEKQA
jgi:adenosine deaminase